MSTNGTDFAEKASPGGPERGYGNAGGGRDCRVPGRSGGNGIAAGPRVRSVAARRLRAGRPASITDRLKDGSAIAQAVATVVAIGVGGLFAWRNAQIFRARAPHVTISHEVSHRFVGTEYVHIAVTAILHNRSRVNIEFRDGLFIIQQIAPSVDEDVEELYASVFLDHEHEDLQWPTLEQARRTWDEDELIVEPRESETETFEFIVSTDVESIVITSYFYNSRVLGKIPDDIELREAPRLRGKLRRWREVRGPRGWSRTTVYDILT